MQLDFTYRRTPKIERNLKRLEIIKRVVDIAPQLPHVEENLRRKSLLKSSLFSARIEGNRLTLADVQFARQTDKVKDRAKLEIFNILGALRWLYSPKAPKNMTKALILRLHRLVMSGLTESPGCFRSEPSAIFSQAGIAIYMPPSPDEVPKLIKQLLSQAHRAKEPAPIKAALFHFAFEKVHPFLDGNGRVGRLLSTFIFKIGGFGFRGLVSFEEYLESNRQTYYDLLTITKKDITHFVEFFLEAIVIQVEKAIEELKYLKGERPEDILLPRRQEILAIIRDHQIVSFDFLKRRFLKVSSSTLHYDLKQLLRQGFIRKLGSTRGVVYASKQS